MEEKLLEIIDKNEKNLNKNKEELEKVIEEQINKHKMEFKEGKLSKTSEQSECEQDLTKIEQELDNIEKDREILKDKQQKEKEIFEEKKIVKKLKINKKECEEAIKEEQGKYSFSEGKFTKTPVLLEYEKDLEKINRELNSKLMGIAKKQKELETLNSHVDKMMSKYNVKSQMKEDKETKTETKEEKEIKTENKEQKETETEDKQEKVAKNNEARVKTEENKVKFEVGPYLGKENINESKTVDIPKIRNNMKSQYVQPNKDLSNIKFAKEDIPLTPNIKYIEILEKEGNINYYIDGDEQEHTISIQQVLEEKKEKFKRLGISDMCKEIAGGRIKGALLKRKSTDW